MSLTFTRSRLFRLSAALCCAVAALVALAVVSLFVGSGDVAPSAVFEVLRGRSSGSADETIVLGLRAPRIWVALLAGAALGMSGALTQTLTRNPLAEPGILGINSGAALAVVAAMSLVPDLPPVPLVVAAMLGSLVAGSVVLLLGGVWRGRHNVVRLVLSGAAFTAVTAALTNYVLVTNPQVFTQFRYWDAGAVQARPGALLVVTGLLSACAVVVLVLIGKQVNALSLGEEMAGSLGINPRRVYIAAGLCAVVLAACATSLVGPVGFLGLMAPLMVRWLTGPRIVPLMVGCALTGALVLLAADVWGRVVLPPREIQASIMCALLGGPVFVAIARKVRGIGG